MCEIKIYNQDDELISSIKTKTVSDAVEKAMAFADDYSGSTVIILQDGIFYSSICNICN